MIVSLKSRLRMSRTISAVLGYVALMSASVQPESDAKLSHTTGCLFEALSIAAAIFGIYISGSPRRAAVAPQNFKKSLLLMPWNSNASRNCLLTSVLCPIASPPYITQSVITLHPCVAPRLVIAAYCKSTPHSSSSSRLGLLCSDALYAHLLMMLCIDCLYITKVLYGRHYDLLFLINSRKICFVKSRDKIFYGLSLCWTIKGMGYEALKSTKPEKNRKKNDNEGCKEIGHAKPFSKAAVARRIPCLRAKDKIMEQACKYNQNDKGNFNGQHLAIWG